MVGGVVLDCAGSVQERGGVNVKKPDRFEREVVKWIDDTWSDSMPKEYVVRFLRKEHAWMVRMVKQLTRYDEFEEYYPERQYGLAAMKKGRFIKLGDVLDQLTQRKK